MALPGGLLAVVADEDPLLWAVEAWGGVRSGLLVLLPAGLQEVCLQPLPSLQMLSH